MRVAYRHIRPVTVVFARGTGGYASAAEAAWDKLGQWLAEHQLRRQVKRGFGLFHDSPRSTPAELQRYDACVELMPGIEADPAAGIGRQTLQGGTYAVHTHVGSYEVVGSLLSDLSQQWVAKQGLTVDSDRAFMAIYLNDPQITREVHRRTELCVPVLPLRDVLPAAPTAHNEDFVSPLMRRAVGLD